MARILLVSQPTVGGTAVHVAALVRYARTAGHQVVVACPKRGDLARWVVAAGAEHVELEMERGVDLGEIRKVWRLRRLIRSADLVHFHSSKAGAIGRVALKTVFTGRPVSVFTPHGWSWLVGGAAARLFRAVEWLLAPATDAIVAVSAWEAGEGRAVLETRAAITTIPNGIDVSRFSPTGPRAVRTRSQTVLIVGRLTRAKGQDVALRAAALMRDVDVEFRFLGAGEDAPRLRTLAERLELRNAVFLGDQDPAPHYRLADLVLIPSRWDACSLVLLEALACGAPVVASPWVGVAGAFPAGVHHLGSLDPAEIATTVRQLLMDEDARRSGLAEAARTVRSRWDDGTRMGETLGLYNSLLASGAGDC